MMDKFFTWLNKELKSKPIDIEMNIGKQLLMSMRRKIPLLIFLALASSLVCFFLKDSVLQWLLFFSPIAFALLVGEAVGDLLFILKARREERRQREYFEHLNSLPPEERNAILAKNTTWIEIK